MNELTNRDVKLMECIRDTCAELDPLPEHVLAAARGALGWGLPTRPFGWCSASRNRAENGRLFRVHTSTAAIGGTLSYGLLPCWQHLDPGGSPAHT
jgi:hypothetical protein